MSSPNGVGSDAPPTNPTPGIQRLLFVSDAAVADVDELPPVVRALIDAATEVNVLTPTLPGRLAWLADDVDRFRHCADERLDAVLSYMHTIGADAGGAAAPWKRADGHRGRSHSVRARSHPDRAARLRARQLAGAPAHRARREPLSPAGHHIRSRPRRAHVAPPTVRCCCATTDPRMPSTRSSTLGALLGGRDALVVTVWQPTPALGSFAIRRRDRRAMFDFVAGRSRRRRPRRARRPRRRSHRATGRPSRQAGRRRGRPDRCGRRSSRSPTATTPPSSPWDPAD